MRMRRCLGAWLIGIGVVWSVAALAQTPDVPHPARIEAGRKVYEREKCAVCHQIAGRGNIRFPLDGVGKKLTSDQIRRWMTDTARMEDALPRLPVVRMSARKYRLNATDLDALVSFLQALK